MNPVFLAIIYCVSLFWMFLGMNIIADIFMNAIEVITSGTRIVLKEDPYTRKYVQTKVNVWNPTVANLTLMALGSSAPEILLNVIETVQTLGSKPGELGPSTIVGSAAFNFLLISGISIYSVTADNDNRTDEDRKEAGTPKGVKKVQDVGVFAITTTWSVIAYIWLYVVLLDGVVKPWEAYLTLGFFFALILMAYIADCLRRKTVQQREDTKYGGDGQAHEQGTEPGKSVDLGNIGHKTVVDFYNTLLPQEAGQKANDAEEEKVSADMREFLM